MDSFTELMNQQAHAYICGPLGHNWKLALPAQLKQESYEVLALCPTCKKERWLKLSKENFQKLLEDKFPQLLPTSTDSTYH